MAQLLVLCYHAVSDRWDAPLSVTPEELRRQLTSLVSRGWVGATFADAVAGPTHLRTLVVTFDDGFDSVRTRAAPLLAELGIPGTVFVPTDWPGAMMRWPEIDHWAATEFAGELQAMSWDALRALSAAGWEIGAHTCSHPHLTRLGAAQVESELRESKAACEREIGEPCRSFAYPFGDADERVRAAVAAAGFEVAAGLSSEAFVSRDRLEWPRVGVWHGEPAWRFELKVAPVTSYLRRARPAGALDAVRRHRTAAR